MKSLLAMTYSPRRLAGDASGVDGNVKTSRKKSNKIDLNEKSPGNDLLSQGATPQVPSALASLTSGFGMLPGVSSSLLSPRDKFLISIKRISFARI